jgi:hypothetical protein
MVTRLRPTSILIVLLAGAACSPQHRNTIAGPTAIAQPESAITFTNTPADVTFPPRNEPFLFRTNLESKYRDGLRRDATTSFVDIEGTIVWTQEYLRYRVNQCSHADAVARVLRQVDGASADPVCGASSTAAFPPRNEPLDFRNQLEQKYRDGLRREPTTTFVDVEGDIVWTIEYMRYRLSSCGHAAAESKVFAQIDDRSVIPPDCTVCSGVPGVTAFLGWATFDVPAGAVRMTWEPVRGVTSYVLEFGTTRGASNVAVVDVSGAATSHTFFRLAAGDYFARVRARNDCGVGAASNEANPRVR